MKLSSPIPTTSGSITRRQISFVAIEDLTPDPDNPRKHNRSQIRAIARSIKAFGFTVPLLVDKYRKIIAGVGRFEASKEIGLSLVPVIFLDDLTETQVRAYRIADNQLSDLSCFDDVKIATQLKELSEIVLDFDIAALGFELPEIDFRIQSLQVPDEADKADQFDTVDELAISIPGDLWLLGRHRLYCANALDPTAYTTLMETEKAAAVFTDPPYNEKIVGHVSGNGAIKHREFAMASGEMTGPKYTDFLTTSLTLMCSNSAAGAVVYVCMDWRHLSELLAAGRVSGCDLINLCVWAKSNGGMGSFYRSQHELVFVFRNGKQPHLNNVQLGRFGRNRTNVWFYPGANSFPRKESTRALELHPTVKPIALVADAILDSTKRGDIILDPFLGSGTTILAAERTGRRCFGIEIDGGYVDTAIARWERLTGKKATHIQGQTFAEIKMARRIDQ